MGCGEEKKQHIMKQIKRNNMNHYETILFVYEIGKI